MGLQLITVVIQVIIEKMEVQAHQKNDAQPLCSIDFGQFVKALDVNVQKSLLSRRNRQLVRQKLKENWLTRSKIIPPSFAKLTSQQNYSPSTPNALTPPHALFHTSFRDTPLPATQHHIDPPQPPSRKECKTTHPGLRSLGSREPLKSNWRLEFRRDELNVLKYLKKGEEDFANSSEQITSQKQFKVRKIHKKFDQLRPNTLQLYRTNMDCVEERTLSPKPLQRTLECTSMHRNRYVA